MGRATQQVDRGDAMGADAGTLSVPRFILFPVLNGFRVAVLDDRGSSPHGVQRRGSGIARARDNSELEIRRFFCIFLRKIKRTLAALPERFSFFGRVAG